MPPQIHVDHLSKHYQVHEKEPGLTGSLRAFFARKYKAVKAVDEVSFDIAAGEMVGFLGPNGAGKTTTLKVLSGLLYPTSGTATVLGYTPHRRESAYLRRFTLVMGQKQQLLWDLPAIETFLINQAIYEIPQAQYAATLKELDELLELGPLLRKQVRKLSLGERMKCELAAALLHRPEVLFLAEPTIGLGVTMHPRFCGGLQRPLRRDRHPDQPLHGGCHRVVQPDHRHRQGPPAVRRRFPGLDRADGAL